MDLPRNAFKAALKEGRRQIGIWCSLGDASSAELLATCGYDWMLFDCEHTPVGPAEAANFLRAVAPYGTSAVVRPAWNDPVEIKKLLDVGAQSLLVPYVQSAEEARAAVAAVRYPPHGMRGLAGITRATRYGAVEGYHARASEEICLLVQVETTAALAQIEEIAAVDGVDGIFVGPADLAASLGLPGQASHPEVRAAVVDAVRRIRAAGCPPGFLSADQSFLREVSDAGGAFVAVDIDTAILRRGALSRRAEWPS